MPELPALFRTIPIAHRGYHDRTAGRIENSLSAARAAISAGYGIELDIQPSSDGVPMVFHDDTLDRLTALSGPIKAQTAAKLSATSLAGTTDCIPTFADFLGLVAGRVPLLIEIKDQDGASGANVGVLEASVARVLESYRGPVAVMSFNPHSVAAMARVAPGLPRGLTTCSYPARDWPSIPEAERLRLMEIPDYATTGSSFISHEAADLGRARVGALKAEGAAILCWTIRSPEAEVSARKVAHNITFENYAAPLRS